MFRRFHSYGPVDLEDHYGAPRPELVERCVQQLVGNPGKLGHFFTIWSARQCGKTWLMRRAVEEIQKRYGERFVVARMSMQGSTLEPGASVAEALAELQDLSEMVFRRPVPRFESWGDWKRLFRKDGGFFDRPVILLIDEFDKLPQEEIDRLVALFRDMYLERHAFWLHGLALIGVRAVLGVDSPRGSPFNVQRSLKVPNLTWEEVEAMFRDYQEESGQRIEPEVVQALFDLTLGQPGLVGWLGELLTETHNPDLSKPISWRQWKHVQLRAMYVEPSNTIMNLLAKARGPYLSQVMELFKNPRIKYSFYESSINYLAMNGIICEAPGVDERGEESYVCRFSSPFVQKLLYDALATEYYPRRYGLYAIPPLDGLEDVLSEDGLHLERLIPRYQDYLVRERAAGYNPRLGQGLRDDLRTVEAAGHFHLYAWLRLAVGGEAVVAPEFPTGNGKVDLLVAWKSFKGIIEVKSFRRTSLLGQDQQQTAAYARQLGLNEAVLVMFAEILDESVLTRLSSEHEVEGVRVTTIAVGW